MRVRAKRLGYYGTKRKKEGDCFDISDEKKNPKDENPMAFSKHWMEKVEAKAPTRSSKAKPAKGKAEKEVDLDVI